jgi:hypothetical protein
MAHNVPIRESVGSALRYVREHISFIAAASAAAAIGMTLIGALNLAAPQFGIATSLASTFVQAFVYAAFVGGALFGSAAVRQRWLADGNRVWAAMAIIGFLLLIVMFAASMVASLVLAAGPLASYLPALTTAGGNQAEVLAVMTRFAEENPMAVLLLTLFLGGIWMLLTSRFYLAAPATVDQQRILTFETWSWTRGSMLRILGARLLVLIPANIFVGAIGLLVGRLVGMNTLDPGTMTAAASSNAPGYLIYIFVTAFLSIGLYSALEAGLSSYLYRGLKPAEEATPPAA